LADNRQPATDDYKGPDPERIRSMFASISRRYDRANTVLSGGIHHVWRKKAVAWSGATAGQSVLDCATGTGDLAIAFKKAVGPGGRVIGTDFVPEMLEVARTKARDIEFQQADVTKLQFGDATFDISSISFGIRNVNDPRLGIAELARVVRPGGRVIVLEFGQPQNRFFGAVYDFYRRRILPTIGGVVTGRKNAYRYLETSAGRFPCGEEFAQLMRDSASFATVEWRPLTFGIAYLYRGIKR
jgi:demethylmenaquinone methyltransferase/2-methoxy-6-polyprenyl-1,4-benzoquinol methylase